MDVLFREINFVITTEAKPEAWRMRVLGST